jgi:hypothetical protein
VALAVAGAVDADAAGEGREFSSIWGIHLTPVTPTGSVRGYGGLSADTG